MVLLLIKSPASSVKELYKYSSSRAAMGLKNLWAMKISGPKKAMHFWKVLYLALIYA